MKNGTVKVYSSTLYIIIAVQNFVIANPTCLVTQSQNIEAVYTLPSSQQLLYTRFKLFSRQHQKCQTDCSFKGNKTKIHCSICYSHDNQEIQLRGLNKSTSSYIGIGDWFFWNSFAPKCDCSKVDSNNIMIHVLDPGTSYQFLSYKASVKASGDLTEESSKFYQCNGSLKNLTSSCNKALVLLRNFDLCQDGEMCVKTKFHQCNEEAKSRCIPYSSFLNKENDLVNNLECRIENGHVVATWRKRELKEIKYFQYKITREEVSIKRGTTLSTKIYTYVGHVLSDKYLIELSPCATCKCFGAVPKTCEFVHNNNTTIESKTSKRKDTQLIIGISMAITVILLMGFVSYFIYKRRILNIGGRSISSQNFNESTLTDHVYASIEDLQTRFSGKNNGENLYNSLERVQAEINGAKMHE